MRENMGLYRGKRKDNGEWVEGFYVQLHDSKGRESHRIYSGYAETDCGDYYPDWHEVIPETVGECSGLPDKTGKLIFEGDILDTTNSNSRIWYVDYKKTAFCCNQGNANYSCELDDFMRYSDVEVIGSIHDNPELLEVSGGD